jgi:hypothetical protein
MSSTIDRYGTFSQLSTELMTKEITIYEGYLLKFGEELDLINSDDEDFMMKHHRSFAFKADKRLLKEHMQKTWELSIDFHRKMVKAMQDIRAHVLQNMDLQKNLNILDSEYKLQVEKEGNRFWQIFSETAFGSVGSNTEDANPSLPNQRQEIPAGQVVPNVDAMDIDTERPSTARENSTSMPSKFQTGNDINGKPCTQELRTANTEDAGVRKLCNTAVLDTKVEPFTNTGLSYENIPAKQASSSTPATSDDPETIEKNFMEMRQKASTVFNIQTDPWFSDDMKNGFDLLSLGPGSTRQYAPALQDKFHLFRPLAENAEYKEAYGDNLRINWGPSAAQPSFLTIVGTKAECTRYLDLLITFAEDIDKENPMARLGRFYLLGDRIPGAISRTFEETKASQIGTASVGEGSIMMSSVPEPAIQTQPHVQAGHSGGLLLIPIRDPKLPSEGKNDGWNRSSRRPNLDKQENIHPADKMMGFNTPQATSIGALFDSPTFSYANSRELQISPVLQARTMSAENQTAHRTSSQTQKNVRPSFESSRWAPANAQVFATPPSSKKKNFKGQIC